LPRAQKIQKRAASVNFDWPDANSALLKIEEELSELKEAIAACDAVAMEEELGDLLFSCVNVARHLDLDAEASLRLATAKFEMRFNKMVELAARSARGMDEFDAAQLHEFWLQAKRDGGD